MNCAACSARVEKAVSKVDGVTSCSASLLTNSMDVKETTNPVLIIKVIVNAEYGAAEKEAAANEKHFKPYCRSRKSVDR